MKHPPYHLRINKAVDRFLLARTLTQLGQLKHLNKYTYYGFGGPFLEDCKLLNEYCPDIRLVSLEKNEATYKRQIFHRFTKNMSIHHESLGVYLDTFSSKGTEVFWLDYTDNKVGRFSEFERVLNLSTIGTVVRITLRADIPNSPYRYRREADYKDKYEDFEDSFSRKYGKYLPDNFCEESIAPEASHELVQDMLQICAEKTLPATSGTFFQPIFSSYYADGAKMLSVTGMICDSDEETAVRRTFADLDFATLDWSSPKQIDVPMLSTKERLSLEHLLPMKPQSGNELKSLIGLVGYRIADTDDANLFQLQQYAEYYKYYPYFVKMVI